MFELSFMSDGALIAVVVDPPSTGPWERECDLRWRYTVAVVEINPTRRFPGGRRGRMVTVSNVRCTWWPDLEVNLRSAMIELNKLEPGWGTTEDGDGESSESTPSALSAEEIVAVLKKHIDDLSDDGDDGDDGELLGDEEEPIQLCRHGNEWGSYCQFCER